MHNQAEADFTEEVSRLIYELVLRKFSTRAVPLKDREGLNAPAKRYRQK